MTNREMELIRFSEGIMTQQEKDVFLSEVNADPILREELQAERMINNILRADAIAVKESKIIDTIPGAPLIERLSITAVPSSSKVVYYIAGAIAFIAVLVFLYFNRNSQPLDSATRPILQINQQSAPPITSPEKPANLQAQPEKGRITTESNKVNIEKPLPAKKDIDLDQDLKDKPVKVFTDPKGHMPIKN